MATTSNISSTIQAVHTEAVELGGFLKGLQPEDWRKDSACQGWKIGDVVAHLAQGAPTWVELINRALDGDASPPPGQQALQPGDRGSEATARRAIEQRESQGTPELLESFVSGHDQLDKLLQNLKPQDWDLPCFHRRGVVTVGDMVARRVQELAIHGWDVRSTFDSGHQISDSAIPTIVSIAHLWLGNAFCPNSHLLTPVRYRFEISGPVPVNEDLVVHSARYEVEPISSQAADVTFKGTGSDYILLIYGRLKMGQAGAKHNLKIEGSRELAQDFNTWFQGV